MQNSSILTHTHTRTLHWKYGGKLGGGTHKLTEYLISALALAVASGALPSEHVAFHPGPWPVAPPGTCPVDSTARPGRRPRTAHPATRRHCRQLTQTFEPTRAYTPKPCPKTTSKGFNYMLCLKSLVELTNCVGHQHSLPPGPICSTLEALFPSFLGQPPHSHGTGANFPRLFLSNAWVGPLATFVIRFKLIQFCKNKLL